MSNNPPVIGFELGVGEFRIVTPDVVYHIRVLPELITANTNLGVISHQIVPAQASPLPVAPAQVSPLPTAPTYASPVQVGSPPTSPPHGTVSDPNFFQEISQELFQSVGQLARQLSISVGELPGDPPSGTDLSKTGADLEDAKGQLEEVVELTEKASMTIMDLADQIQADMDDLNIQMSTLNNLESLLAADSALGAKVERRPESGSEGGQGLGKAVVPREFMEKFVEIQAFIDSFGGQSQDVEEIVPLSQAEEPQIDEYGAEGPQTDEHGAEGPQTGEQGAEEPQTGEYESEEPQIVVTFDLDVVFQTLYEFCTNESVKDHIKTMREASTHGHFKTQVIEQELSLQSVNLEPDDGFYNFPIPGLLKLLYSNTSVEDFKNILKKMNQTVDSIFLEGNLPLEGHEETIFPETPKPEPAPVPPKPEPAPAPPKPETAPDSPKAEPKPIAKVTTPLSQPTIDDMQVLGGMFHELEKLLPGEISEAKQIEGYATIPIADRDTIIQTVTSSEALIKNTSKHLTHIMEALSFQDLSGQRIKKIVNLISEIQVQLLTLLVSVNSKIKAHHEAPTQVRPKEEREKVAQAEVDKMLEKLSAEPSDLKGPGAENRLDQGAVNDLLAQLGF
ncbi:MAG: protein phosphatase CheZ [Deltaproteobacteria bacterium]|jgi:chemotaxis regulatin CheY-phosphate phosphatase CheZ|nr:protein phosphatase CheZ [Deltaproteobacteria bacterium]